MAANINPIFGRTPDVQLAGAILGSNANTATDGTGSNMYQIFEADATEGSFVQSVRLKAISTIAATVARIWFCSDTGTFTAGTTNDATNTTLIAEIAIAAWTVSQTVASPVYEIPINMALPPGTKLLISFGTSTGASTTGFNPLVIGMKY
jgi:hypothetical protein